MIWLASDLEFWHIQEKNQILLQQGFQMSLKKCGVTGNFAGGIFHLEGRLLKEWLQPFDPFMMVKNIQQWSK